jgi:CRISPR-associated protein Cmr4
MNTITTDAYLITCLTNLHVGAEGVNYGVVDNLVQRDTITNIPVINASSLKGALREFFKNEWKENNDKLNYIFGPDSTRNNSSGKEGIGNYKFFEARLLSLPMRSDVKPFYNVTTIDLLDNINSLYKAFKNKNLIDKTGFSDIKESSVRVKLEDWFTVAKTDFPENKWIGENIATFDTDTFKKVVKSLPVIARNKLDNGESKNLWYEEVVPRESRFVFLVSKTDEYQVKFDELIEDNVIQIGGNASVGYGFCKINKIV